MEKKVLCIIYLVVLSCTYICVDVVDNNDLCAQTGDVYVGIRDRGIGKIRIAILPFYPKGSKWGSEEVETRESLSRTISSDLDFSLFFDIFDTAFFPQKDVHRKEDINFFAWSQLDVNAVLFGSFELDDRIKIEANLFSINSAKPVLKEDYEASAVQTRRLAHRISDDIIKVLTGDEGICQTQIAFVSNRSGVKEIFICDYDGYGIRQLTKNNSITIYPDWSPTGFNISYTSYKHGNPDLFMVDWTNNKEVKLSDFDGLNTTAAWSPDGKKIAYTLTKEGNSDIYILDTRSGRLEKLTFDPSIDCSPTWSPTGDKIAFTSDRSGSPQIYTIDAVGTNLRRLTFLGNYNDLPNWRPGKGDLIAYSSRVRGQFDVCTIDVNGENPICLTSIGNNERPYWSPDGYHIVFASDRSGNYQLYTVDWTGDNINQITFGYSSSNTDPTWSPRMRWKFE
ncbi:Tol-Pal system beta propeller repeat protein TolB [bacterium]|nr:Tol-Pal system beta propeller repeat protein TolB [bacterium]